MTQEFEENLIKETRMILLTGFANEEAEEWLPKSRDVLRKETPFGLPSYWTSRYVTQEYTGRTLEAGVYDY